jgi:hypothetical protein
MVYQIIVALQQILLAIGLRGIYYGAMQHNQLPKDHHV